MYPFRYNVMTLRTVIGTKVKVHSLQQAFIVYDFIYTVLEFYNFRTFLGTLKDPHRWRLITILQSYLKHFSDLFTF